MKNVKRNATVILLILVLLIAICITVILINCNNNKNKSISEGSSTEFKLSTKNTYILTTDYCFKTMQNDGGSNTNIYYQIDLENNFVNKCEDKYVGFKGYEYQGKILSSKKIDSNQNSKIKEIIDTIIDKKDEEKDIEKTSYMYYTLKTIDENEIMVNDYDLIKKLTSELD